MIVIEKMLIKWDWDDLIDGMCAKNICMTINKDSKG
jgi:hypothetical protein